MSIELKLSRSEQVKLLFRAYIDCHVMRYGASLDIAPSIEALMNILEKIEENVSERIQIIAGVCND